MDTRDHARHRSTLELAALCALLLGPTACGGGGHAGARTSADPSTPAMGSGGAPGATQGGSGSGGSGSGGSGVAGKKASGDGGAVGQDAGGGSGGVGESDAGDTHDAGSVRDAGDGGSDAGAVAFVNPAPGSKFFVGANFWNIDWEGQDDFFQSGVDFATTSNPWRPELLDDLAPYHVLRFMDWNGTNESNNPQANWDARKHKTDPQDQPVAIEWQIDLCNRAQKDYWITVPHEADADYWTKLAQLIESELDPRLRVYVEYSNEVWNGSFPQHDDAASKAQSLSLPGSDPAAAYYVYASVRLYAAFESVFGAGSPRLIKVLSGQAAWTGPCEAHVQALADPTINPNGEKPDVYAIAPYFGGTSIGQLGNAIDTVTQWTRDHVTCAAKAGLPLISYEGGSDSYSAGNGCTTLQHDPGMHDLYMSYLDGLSGAGMTGPFMQYTHTGTCWGLKEKTGDSLDDSPKYKGVIDWLAAHP